MIMARLALVWMLVLGLGCADKAFAAPEDMSREGAWALEFQLQPAFYGSSSYGIATKYHLSERLAARIGFLVALGNSDGEGSRKFEQLDPTDSTTSTFAYDTDSDGSSGSVFLHFVQYATLADRFGLSFDIGPVFAWNRNTGGQTPTGPPPPSSVPRFTTFESTQKSYGFEIQGGFEWRFTGRLSLAGRYGLSAVRNESHQTSTTEFTGPNGAYRDRIESTGESSGFSVQTTSSVFSLIAYW